jgi:hypothetical protein
MCRDMFDNRHVLHYFFVLKHLLYVVIYSITDLFVLNIFYICLEPISNEQTYLFFVQKEHDEEELVLWRSILKCVEEHSPCSSEMSCVSIAERIKVLEERIGKPSQAIPSV